MKEMVDVEDNSKNCGMQQREKKCGKRKEAKMKRYSEPSGSITYFPCKYSSKTLLCANVTPTDIKRL